MPRRAFTLVELLVVISIIGLLSTVAVVALGSTRSGAHNV
jgi:prepilin-type N-terminal cleavage/methylation domain-containing protein